MARVALRTFRPRAARRKTVWIGTAIASTVTVGSGLSVIHSSFDPSALSILAGTLVRVRGMVLARPTTFGADSSWGGAFGLAVVSDEAFSQGASACPNPITDQSSNKFFTWIPWFTDFRLTSTFVAEFNSFSRYDFDVKAMRKVNEGDTIVVMIENSVAEGALFAIQFRMLLLLH